MTTLTVPTSLEQDANPRPLPWWRMVWVTWRQHRIALGGVAVFLGAVAVWLWIAGLQLHHAYAAAVACHPAGSPACSELTFNFDATGGMLKGGFVLQPVPALIGAFVGPLVLARELETGTFRYAWTQGFGRVRWTLAKLVLLGVAVAAIASAFSVLVSWYYQPYLATGRLYDPASPLLHWLFDLRGVALAGWTLAAFAFGAFAGMLIRRVVPAIVATLAGYTVLAVVVGDVLPRRLPADQPLLANPVDRGRRAARIVATAHPQRLVVARSPSPRRLAEGQLGTRPRASKVPDLALATPCYGCFGVVSRLFIAHRPPRSDGDCDRHAPGCGWSCGGSREALSGQITLHGSGGKHCHHCCR